jgi:hypothetical protein
MNRQLKSFLLLIVVSLAAVAVCYFFLFKMSSFGPGKQDFTKNLSGGYKLYRMSSNNIFIAPGDVWNESAIIPEKVVRLCEYKDYVIAERQLLSRLSTKDNLNSSPAADTVSNYWILNTHEHTMIKNVSSEQLKNVLDSLGIPGNIKLADVYEY